MVTVRDLIDTLQRFHDHDAEIKMEPTSYDGAALTARTDDAYYLLYLMEPTVEGPRVYLHKPEKHVNVEPEEKWWP